MKSPLSIVGIVLIVVGIAILAYQGITYTKRETVAQIGNVEVTADTQKTIYLSPLTGGLVLTAGVILLIVGQRRS